MTFSLFRAVALAGRPLIPMGRIMRRRAAPPTTGSKVAIGLEDQEGRISEGSYAESLWDAGADATDYRYDAESTIFRRRFGEGCAEGIGRPIFCSGHY